MKRKSSSFDRIKAHLIARGENAPVSGRLGDDLDVLVRRCDEIRSLGREFGEVELSPYMSSLLRISASVPAGMQTVGAQAVASV